MTTPAEKAKELGIETEQRMVVLNMELPIKVWTILDEAEKNSDITINQYFHDLLLRILADRLIMVLLSAEEILRQGGQL